MHTEEDSMGRQAIRIYWFASFLAVIEAFFLFILGLDLRFEQVKLFFLFGFPAPVIMYVCDRWLITRHTRAIDAVLQLPESGQAIPPDMARRAYLQALNLPILTLLRVLTIHAPSVLVPLTVLCLLANHLVDLGLAWWQFLVLWSFWPITAAPHAIVEYFLVDRAVRAVLDRLEELVGEPITATMPHATAGTIVRLLFGLQPATPQIIRLSAGVQLAWLFFFVSLMPMFVLGASVYLKLTSAGAVVLDARPLSTLGLWIAFLLLLNAVISVAIVTLLSRRVRRSMQDLLARMQRILNGDLSGYWTPRTTDEFLDLGAGFNTMLLGLRERETLKDTFGRFVSRDVAAAVLGGQVPLQGEVREVSILFQDIRGFTSLSERTPPAALLQLVNEFFTEMVAAVEAHGGTVKQFTGDGVMALFGAPVNHPDAPTRAVRAALDMLERLEALNQRRSARGEVPLRIGVGIHTGEVVAGCIGPDKRIEYGVVGDAVNLASRVQDLTKQVGATVLITEATAGRLGNGFVLGRRVVLPVRGKQQPIEVIEVLHERWHASLAR
jgi:class 3 adenylate cyclase